MKRNSIVLLGILVMGIQSASAFDPSGDKDVIKKPSKSHLKCTFNGADEGKNWDGGLFDHNCKARALICSDVKTVPTPTQPSHPPALPEHPTMPGEPTTPPAPPTLPEPPCHTMLAVQCDGKGIYSGRAFHQVKENFDYVGLKWKTPTYEKVLAIKLQLDAADGKAFLILDKNQLEGKCSVSKLD